MISDRSHLETRAGSALCVAAGTPVVQPSRSDLLDALRGASMLWMTAFHFCFDLHQFGYLVADFYRDPRWTVQRGIIVSLFLFCAGLGQALALHQGQGWPRFWRRWRQILLAALLVTAGSWFMFPASFIYFGILHGMAVMLVLARLLAPLGGWLYPAGLAIVAMPTLAGFAHPLWPWLECLNGPGLNWLGWISRKPVTEDYAPLAPWLGVMLWGLATGQCWLRQQPGWLRVALPVPLRPLAALGRHSLSWYLLHQPLLIGALMLLQRF